MDFIQYAMAWHKGEAFEALLSMVFGLFLILIAALFWRMGTTQGSQAIVTPLVAVALILSGTGVFNVYTNRQKVEQLKHHPPVDENEFLQAEKKRVEGFQFLYTFTKYLALGLFSIALLIVFFTENKHAQSIAIALILLGQSGLIIDYFSKERADEYYKQIVKRIQ